MRFRASHNPTGGAVTTIHVIAEIGAPLHSEQRDGVTVDVFAFKQGYTKGTKAGRALVHGAADVVTGGLWEVVGIPAESLADGSSVKVEVTYDTRRAVRSIEVFEGQEQITPPRMFARFRKAQAETKARVDAMPAVEETPAAEIATQSEGTPKAG